MFTCIRVKTFRSYGCPRDNMYHTYIKAMAAGKTVRIPLSSPNVIGVADSRGSRMHQEDAYQIAAISLNPDELAYSARKLFGISWNPKSLREDIARQMLFVGIYDGHGGQAVSYYLHQNLHGLFESVDKTQIPEIYTWLRELGGYFRRFRGGILSPWLHNAADSGVLDIESRATLAFLEADKTLSEGYEGKTCGATASVVLLHCFDIPQAPFYTARRLGLTVAHCGDTRVILCATQDANVFLMTQDHHADARTEAARLRRMGGTGLITDSFGEVRWMGAVANTRSIGDLKFKPFGVTAEPETRSKLLEGDKWAFIVLVTDGISSVVSDAEIVDIVRQQRTPKQAADAVLSFAEEMGSEDNGTVIVLPLSSWNKVEGPDRTKDLREYRRQQAVGSERQRRM